MNIRDYAKQNNVSYTTVYARMKELGRLPTPQELQKKKSGRKRKYDY